MTGNILCNDVHGEDNRTEESTASGDSRTEVAGAPHGITAADAAAYLERSGAAVKGLSGISEEIDRQAACLIVWAKVKGLILPERGRSRTIKYFGSFATRRPVPDIRLENMRLCRPFDPLKSVLVHL